MRMCRMHKTSWSQHRLEGVAISYENEACREAHRRRTHRHRYSETLDQPSRQKTASGNAQPSHMGIACEAPSPKSKLKASPISSQIMELCVGVLGYGDSDQKGSGSVTKERRR